MDNFINIVDKVINIVDKVINIVQILQAWGGGGGLGDRDPDSITIIFSNF